LNATSFVESSDLSYLQHSFETAVYVQLRLWLIFLALKFPF